METINTIELKDEQVYPDSQVLERVLGKSYAAYCELLALYDRMELEPEWRYYKDGKAWLCKVQKKKRTVVWMSAWNGFMQAAVYFPDKDIDEILALGIEETTREKIRTTKNVGKTRPCIFEIRDTGDLVDLETVMQFVIRYRTAPKGKAAPAGTAAERRK
ncbi:MAG: DUF3788 family protein [Spirochaetaceae bacterium]|nr:MAG: DUF3788 family protein [Spirochaetaceae bacterium]